MTAKQAKLIVQLDAETKKELAKLPKKTLEIRRESKVSHPRDKLDTGINANTQEMMGKKISTGSTSKLGWEVDGLQGQKGGTALKHLQRSASVASMMENTRQIPNLTPFE